MRRVQPLEKDPVSGEYKLPARVGILTVHSLGRVVPLPTYHNDRYIWPPGFKVSRYVYKNERKKKKGIDKLKEREKMNGIDKGIFLLGFKREILNGKGGGYGEKKIRIY